MEEEDYCLISEDQNDSFSFQDMLNESLDLAASAPLGYSQDSQDQSYGGSISYPCKRNSDGLPVNNVNKNDKQVQTEDDLESSWERVKEDYLEESACSICLENFVISGEHKVAALKCGHIFGDVCIKRWMSEAKGDGGPKCPTCKSKAKPTDIKYIEPKTIKKSDPSIVVHFNEKVQAIRTERIRVESELSQCNYQIERLREELASSKKSFAAEEEEFNRLEVEIYQEQQNRINMAVSSSMAANRALQRSRLQPLSRSKRLDLEPGSDSRVCSVNDMFGLIMIAQKKVINSRPTFGLTNIGLENFRATNYVALHSQQIKDIAFHPFDSVLLSASMDKTIKLTDAFSFTSIDFTLEEQVWSCCWNEVNTETFYAGLRNGTVYEYDRRNNSRPSSVIPAPPGMITRTPCASINFVHIDRFSGIVSTRLQNSTFSYRGPDRYISQQLPASGIFMSSHFERKTAKLLYSARPSKNTPHVTHSLYSLSRNTNAIPGEPPIYFRVDKCFSGGTHADQVLKGRLFAHPEKDSSLVFVGDQDIGGAIVWDSNNTESIQKIGGIGTVFDVAQLEKSDPSKTSFILLTDKSLYNYKWNLSDNH